MTPSCCGKFSKGTTSFGAFHTTGASAREGSKYVTPDHFRALQNHEMKRSEHRVSNLGPHLAWFGAKDGPHFVLHWIALNGKSYGFIIDLSINMGVFHGFPVKCRGVFDQIFGPQGYTLAVHPTNDRPVGHHRPAS